eukprot:1212748-Prymnesium_polylepis.1
MCSARVHRVRRAGERLQGVCGMARPRAPPHAGRQPAPAAGGGDACALCAARVRSLRGGARAFPAWRCACVPYAPRALLAFASRCFWRTSLSSEPSLRVRKKPSSAWRVARSLRVSPAASPLVDESMRALVARRVRCRQVLSCTPGGCDANCVPPPRGDGMTRAFFGPAQPREPPSALM